MKKRLGERRNTPERKQGRKEESKEESKRSSLVHFSPLDRPHTRGGFETRPYMSPAPCTSSTTLFLAFAYRCYSGPWLPVARRPGLTTFPVLPYCSGSEIGGLESYTGN